MYKYITYIYACVCMWMCHLSLPPRWCTWTSLPMSRRASTTPRSKANVRCCASHVPRSLLPHWDDEARLLCWVWNHWRSQSWEDCYEPHIQVKQLCDVHLKELDKWQNSLPPSCQFGFIVLTTSAGIMGHEEVRQKQRRKHPGVLF